MISKSKYTNAPQILEYTQIQYGFGLQISVSHMLLKNNNNKKWNKLMSNEHFCAFCFLYQGGLMLKTENKVIRVGCIIYLLEEAQEGFSE